ncbi:MAG: hypothetical protein GY950_20630 [bacterium]|nr:hypothetical protein [bacterium]
MVIVGIKVTHDGGIALIDDGKLVFSIEMEKLNNNPRYSSFQMDTRAILEILGAYGYRMEDIDRIVVDGWCDGDFKKSFIHDVNFGKGPFTIELAEYGAFIKNENIMEARTFDYSEHGLQYNGYTHVAGHVFGGYCAGPFALRGEDSFVLVWDGAICPQLFYYHYHTNRVDNLGPLFLISGQMYGEFARKYKPYDHRPFGDLSIAGKLMAYIAMGEVRETLLAIFRTIYAAHVDKLKAPLSGRLIFETSQQLIDKFADFGNQKGYKPVDMMATFHAFLQELLVTGLRERVDRYPGHTRNLCFTGGCALSIKWNTGIRTSGIFKEMFVPPFTNDSGSAIGTACCEMVSQTPHRALEWDVYKGPALRERIDETWRRYPFTLKECAALLHETSEPVVVLKGRAELGPRALGNRSILAPAVNFSMKEHLNEIKKREDYRPVAPICLEEDAPQAFDPGIPDPFMLFDHVVRDQWKTKIPAVIHLDGTARLQTVSSSENPEIYELLTEYKKLSGVPLLCNTSANLNGRGFFPDVASAMEWGGANFIWSHGTLYVKKGYEKFVVKSESTIKEEALNVDFDI